MGGFAVKPGNTTPDAFARAPVKEHAPSSRATGYETGEDYIDHGAKCDDKQGPGCFLSTTARDRLIHSFQLDVANARTNYQFALTLLKVESMMEKEEDASWVILLALDLAGGHLISVIAGALKSARTAGLAKAQNFGPLLGERSVAEHMIEGVSPAAIDAYAKAGFDPAKTAAKGLAKKSANTEAVKEKSATQAYIALLMDQCDIGFSNFALTASASADDAELVVLWHGMHDRAKHSISAYKVALSAKLDRFKKAGVGGIGHDVVAEPHQEVKDRERRVVYVRDASGHLTPWYQNADRPVFGGGQFLQREHNLERRVPDEFAEIAVARSESVWGPTPTIDDGFSPAFRGQPRQPSTTIEAMQQAFGHYTDPHPHQPVAVDPFDPLAPFRNVKP